MMSDERKEGESPDLESRLRRYNVGPRRERSTLRNYLELMRAPNVFTAMADVTMGFLFVQAAGASWAPTAWDFATLATLIAASSSLYIAGMVLNDVFDLDIDSKERPERPIPSGRVSLDAARRLGWRLLFLGVALGTGTVFFTGHLRPGVAAAVLATTILLYDAWLKRTPLGPLAMGACRTLNVLMGMSAVDASLRAEHWLVAGAIGVYVAGVTWFARNENQRSSRLQLAAATTVMMLGVAMLGVLPHWSHRLLPPLYRKSNVWYILTGVVAVWIAWRCLRAVISPDAARVRTAVARCILWLVMLDVVACYAVRGPLCAGLILLFLPPAIFLRRWIAMT
jgi:4-hydroxybenzoate polyprenyltransferase